jgi:hypothetical protein
MYTIWQPCTEVDFFRFPAEAKKLICLVVARVGHTWNESRKKQLKNTLKKRLGFKTSSGLP